MRVAGLLLLVGVMGACAVRRPVPRAESALPYTLAVQGATSYRLEESLGKVRLVALRRARRPRAELGMRVREIDRSLARRRGLDPFRGLLVASVERHGPAAQAGVLPGDVVVRVAGTEVRYLDQFKELLRRLPAAKPVPLVVARGRKEVALTVSARWQQEEEEERQEVPLEPVKPVTPVPRVGIGLATLPTEWNQKIFGRKEPVVLVTRVEVGSPAYLAGLLPGDRILAVNGRTDPPERSWSAS